MATRAARPNCTASTHAARPLAALSHVAARVAAHRHARSSPTRPSSERTRSRTSRASTRTACSSTGRPTRSCGPRASAPRDASCSASSGRATRCRASRQLGYRLDDAALERVFARFKDAGRPRSAVADAISRPSCRRGQAREEPFPLEGLQVGCGTQAACPRRRCACGPSDGACACTRRWATVPCDAAYKAIDALVQVTVELLEFSVRAVTEGIDALGEVSAVRLRSERDAERPVTTSRDTVFLGTRGRGIRPSARRTSTRSPHGSRRATRPASAGASPSRRGRRGHAARRLGAARPDPRDALREDLGRARRRQDDRRPRRSSTSTSTSSTRSRRRRPSRACALRGRRVRRADRTFATMDHSSPTLPRPGRRRPAGRGAAPHAGAELRRVRRPALRPRLGRAGDRPRHRAGARPHAAGPHHRLRRQPHLDARRLRGARLRHRHERRSSTSSRRSRLLQRGRRRCRCASTAPSRRASARRTSCSAFIAQIGTGGATGPRHRVPRHDHRRARDGSSA